MQIAPVRYPIDPEVQRFVQQEFFCFDAGTYGSARPAALTARELLKAVKDRFGPRRGAGLEFWLH